MTDTRFWLCAVALPGAAALAVLAAVVLPAGGDLGWPRLIAGFGAYLAVHIGGSAAVGARIRSTLERPQP